MQKGWCYLLFMLWFSYLIISSILLFSRGFLLSKNAQIINTTCLSISELPCLDDEDPFLTSGHPHQCNDNVKLNHALTNLNKASGTCLPQKSRVVVMMVDALRYDFILFDENKQEPLPFQNRLPIINKLIKEQAENARIYKFIADAPTTTMQRIKGLTTGSLPTFIDIGANFATPEINEDNIIDQCVRNGHNVVFMGDDTWEGLFPNRFLRKYPFPSFDVWDLDTVDNGVNSHISTELNNTDWSLMIAHYLGIDHCGHRYGPNHSEMERKLTEINTAIKKVVASIDPNTILFVIGDHGMTETGDHGGESENEVTAGFFVYSKKPFFPFNSKVDSIRQVDLVPTLSAILGLPVPYSSIGTVVLNVLPDERLSKVPQWQVPLFHLWANVQQLWTYVDDYSNNYPATFQPSSIKQFRAKFLELGNKLDLVVDDLSFQMFAKESMEFLLTLRESCEKVWVQFDAFSMGRGLLFLSLSIFFVYTIVDGIPANQIGEIFDSLFLHVCYFITFAAIGVSCALYYFEIVVNLTSTIFFSTGLIAQLMLVMLIIQNWEIISLTWYDRSKTQQIPNLICRIVLIFHLCGLFSNSFIIEEATVLLFLLSTIILVASLVISQGELKKKNLRFKLKLGALVFAILFLLRLSVMFWRCRDRTEQPWCYDAYNPFTSKAETTKLQWIITVITLGLFVTITKHWMRDCGNLNGYSATVTYLKYVPTVVVVCTSGFWVLNRLHVDSKANKAVKQWQSNLLAWIVYGFSFSGVLLTIWKPLCIFVLPSNQSLDDVSADSNLIPQLFRRVRSLFNRSERVGDVERKEVPVVCGFGTIYSVVFIAIGVYFTLVFALLHGDAIAPATVVMFLATAFILIIMSVIRLEAANSIDELVDVSNMSVLIWLILSQYFFYGTGHQPTFPNIVWDAAFIGTSGIATWNFIPGSLIIMSTFCSQILLGLLLPLLIVMPFTLSVMFPSIVKKGLMSKENLRGEVLLYERDKLMLSVAFATVCKYIIGQGVRVFASMLSATIHCRHMMVWTIFAPKFIFEGIGMFVTLAVVNISFLILMRVNSKVDQFVIDLTKKYT